MAKIYELHKQLADKKVSSVELTQQYLDNIKQKDSELNAFITVCEDHALAQAKEADKKISTGDFSLLTGVPYAAKDCYCTKGIKSTAGSKILEPYIPPFNATVIEKLSDSVLLGKTNLDEYTMGASGEHSAYGVTKHPKDPKRVPGGSSSGSAVAVATDMAAFALGTDTGGSIRQPASFCGVVGLRATYGRNSRYGVMSMASSFDTIGPLCQDVKDTAIVLQAIAGTDKKDSTTPKVKVDDYVKEIERDAKGMKAGIPKEYFELDGLDDEVKKTVEQAINKIKKLGVEVKEVSLPHTKYAIPVYYIIVSSEVSSNMARYDGIKYGYRAKDTEDLMSVYLKSRQQGFGDEVKRRIMLGTYSLSSGYYDAYYKQASQVRTLMIQDFKQAFSDIDVLLTPTAPTTAFKIGEKTQDPINMYLADIFVAPASCAGVPAVSVPCGEVNGLPVGLQIIGDYFKESDILRLAHSFEQQ